MIAKIPFGRTGHISTRTLFGGVSVGKVTQKVSDEALKVLFEYGVNHIDVAASYGAGVAETHIGTWMKQYRDQFFLATKTGERTYQKSKEQFADSLERLQVDHVDLLQFHNLTNPEEWEVALGPDGALKMAVEARETGKTRCIGVTGHGLQAPAMHLRSLQRYDFDTILVPYNYVLMQIPEYAADFERLLELCQKRNVAVQTIKSVARRKWGERRHTRFPWYEPLEEQADIDKAVHWVLGQPGIFLNTTGDVQLMPRVLDAASRFEKRPSNEEMDELVARQEMKPIFPMD